MPQTQHRIIIADIKNDLTFYFKVPIIKNAKIIASKEAIENPPIPYDVTNNDLTLINQLTPLRVVMWWNSYLPLGRKQSFNKSRKSKATNISR